VIFVEENEIFPAGCSGNKYCFPCIVGLCPYGRDFMRDCYPKLSLEQKMLFDELFSLRVEIAKLNRPKIEVAPLL
jgi:hypothetical protein